jgi:hypothetical protein
MWELAGLLHRRAGTQSERRSERRAEFREMFVFRPASDTEPA